MFFIDAHQTSSGYFFPPNEDPVHHEISHFALDFIQHGIGPALQDAFNDAVDRVPQLQPYDLFTPEYGDTVPALIMGAAGMTYEKGTSEAYAKQVYDHYLAIDTTIKADVAGQDRDHARAGSSSGGEAVDQGAELRSCRRTRWSARCTTRSSRTRPTTTPSAATSSSPTSTPATSPRWSRTCSASACGSSSLDTPVAVNGYHEYGNGTAGDTADQPSTA